MWPPPQWGSRGRRTKWPDCRHKTDDKRRHKSREIINKKIEKYRAKNRSLWNTSMELKGVTFVILIIHTSAPIRKEKFMPNEQSKASQNELVEKGEMPDKVKSFQEINSSENWPSAQPGFVKPI